MKKNIFSKIMACFVVMCCALVVSACDVFQKDDANIVSIEIVESSIPEYIVVGEFDNANIKGKVTYSDGSNELIKITTAMIPDEYHSFLTTPGIYKISIMFRNATAELTVRMVRSSNIYQVNFYNNKSQIISTQFVYDGEDATLPTDEMKNVYGWVFVGWDRSNENISEDTNIYGCYVNVENTLSTAKMQQVLLNAEKYYIESNHFVSQTEVYQASEGTEYDQTTINYHYNDGTKVSTAQMISYYAEGDTNYKDIEIFGETNYAMGFWVSDENGEWQLNSYMTQPYEEIKSANGAEDFEKLLLLTKLYGASEGDTYLAEDLLTLGEVEFSYKLASNKLIYICTVTSGTSTESESILHTYTVIYDEEKILQIQYVYTYTLGEDVSRSRTTTYNIDYNTIPFEEVDIPNFGDVNDDGSINAEDVALVNAYIASTTTLTTEQLEAADVNMSGDVTEYDAKLIQAYIDKKISSLPMQDSFVFDMIFGWALERSIYSDMVMTGVGKDYEDEVEDYTTVYRIDIDNKICKAEYSATQYAYSWESNGVVYEAFVDGDNKYIEKEDGATFESSIIGPQLFSYYGDEMFFGGSINGSDVFEVATIDIVDGNIVITANGEMSLADGGTRAVYVKYTISNGYITKIEMDYYYVGTIICNYSNVDITLPDDIKALEETVAEQ